jgi:hypothetical protein
VAAVLYLAATIADLILSSTQKGPGTVAPDPSANNGPQSDAPRPWADGGVCRFPTGKRSSASQGVAAGLVSIL